MPHAFTFDRDLLHCSEVADRSAAWQGDRWRRQFSGRSVLVDQPVSLVGKLVPVPAYGLVG